MDNRSTTPLLHSLCSRLCQKELAFEDGVEEPVVVLLCQFDEGLGLEDSSIADQNIQTSKLPLRKVYKGDSRLRFTDISGQDSNLCRVGGDFFGRRLQLGLVGSTEDNRCAVVNKT